MRTEVTTNMLQIILEAVNRIVKT